MLILTMIQTPETFQKTTSGQGFEEKIGFFGRQSIMYQPLSWPISTIFLKIYL